MTTAVTLSRSNLQQLLRDTEQQLQAREQEAATLALDAVSGSVDAKNRLAAVEAAIADGRADLRRLEAAIGEAERRDQAERATAKAEQRRQLEAQRQALVACRRTQYRQIHSSVERLTAAVRAALASAHEQAQLDRDLQVPGDVVTDVTLCVSDFLVVELRDAGVPLPLPTNPYSRRLVTAEKEQ